MHERIDPALRGQLEQVFLRVYQGESDPCVAFEGTLKAYVEALKPTTLKWTPHEAHQHSTLFKHFLARGADWFPLAGLLGRRGANGVRALHYARPAAIKAKQWTALVTNRHRFVEDSLALQQAVCIPLRRLLRPLLDTMKETAYHGRGCKDIEGGEVHACWRRILASPEADVFCEATTDAYERIAKTIAGFDALSVSIRKQLDRKQAMHHVARELALNALDEIESQNDMALWSLELMRNTMSMKHDDLEHQVFPRLIAATRLPWMDLFPQLTEGEVDHLKTSRGVDTMVESTLPLSIAHRYAAWFAFDEIYQEVFVPLMLMVDRFERNMHVSRTKAIQVLKDDITRAQLRRAFEHRAQDIERMYRYYDALRSELGRSELFKNEWHKLWNRCTMFISFIQPFKAMMHKLASWEPSNDLFTLSKDIVELRRKYRAFMREQSTSPLEGTGRELPTIELVARMYRYKRKEGVEVGIQRHGTVPEGVHEGTLRDILITFMHEALMSDPHRVDIVVDDQWVAVAFDDNSPERVFTVLNDRVRNLMHGLRPQAPVAPIFRDVRTKHKRAFFVHFTKARAPIPKLR